MFYFSTSCHGCKFFHKFVILALPIHFSEISKIIITDNVISGIFHSGYFVCAVIFEPCATSTTLVFYSFHYITSKIFSGTIAFKRNRFYIVLDKHICTFWFRKLRTGIIKHHINNIHFIAIYIPNRHTATIFTFISTIACCHYCIWLTINRKFLKIIQFFFCKHSSFCFKRFLLELCRPCFFRNKFSFFLIIFCGENLTDSFFIFTEDFPVALISYRIKCRNRNLSPSPTKLICFYL